MACCSSQLRCWVPQGQPTAAGRAERSTGASRIFNTGDIVRYKDKTFRARSYTRNQSPGDPNGLWEEQAPTPPDNSPAAGTPSTVYNPGDRVTYQGHVYEAKWYTHNQAPSAPSGPWN